jgi:hypothetical protein
MIGPDQDLKDFPPWIWPYIRIAHLAEVSKIADDPRIATSIDARIPETAMNAHLMAIMSALTMRKVAAGLDGELGKQFTASANKALSVAIDDCGSTGKKPWPRPPRNVMLLQIAGHLAVAAAELEGDSIMREGLEQAMTTLLKQAGQA